MSTGIQDRKSTVVLDDDGLFDDRPAAGGLTALDVLTAILARKRFIGAVTFVAALVGLILAFVLPTRYRATAKILPPEQQSSAMGLLNSLSSAGGMGALASLAGNSLGIKNPNDLYVSMLKSRTI